MNEQQFQLPPDWNVSEADFSSYARAMAEPEPYKLHEDARKKETTPKGTLHAFTLEDCLTYPKVSHDYWLYVPAQYEGSTPANLIVFLDGLLYEEQCHVSTVLDNLIDTGDLPPTIAVFIAPGPNGPGLPIYGGNDNRSIEYDSANEAYGTFLETELLPIIEEEYVISKDSTHRAICGYSSGGLAAFGTAWFKPHLFNKLLLNSASFTNIRGGHEFLTKVRTEDKRPLKIWLGTGKKDLNVIFGNWKIANEYMASSLAYKGYEHQLHISEGGHTLHYLSSVLPDVLRWLFSNHKP